MSSITKYWWVFALLIGGFLVYWFVFRTPATVAVPKTTTCSTTAGDWATKLAAKKAAINASPTWLNMVQADVTAGKYPTFEAASTAHAEWALKSEGVCKPA